MLNVKGNKVKKIKDDIYDLLKEKKLSDSVSSIINIHSDEYVIPNDDNAQIIIYPISGSNEGWYVVVAIFTLKEGSRFSELIAIRIQDSLEKAILIQNELIRNVDI